MNQEVASSGVLYVAQWAFHVQHRPNGEGVQMLRHESSLWELGVHAFEVNLYGKIEEPYFVHTTCWSVGSHA